MKIYKVLYGEVEDPMIEGVYVVAFNSDEAKRKVVQRFNVPQMDIHYVLELDKDKFIL